MNTAKQVDALITKLKAKGASSETAWQLGLACVGWPYIFGDRGQECTPAHRRSAYASKGADHPTIKSKCKNFEGGGSCSGCQYYPGGRTRALDCRGFTWWVLKQIFDWELKGAGCTSQWNNAANWKAKGKISDGIPKDTLVCLFYSKNNQEKTWEHTGFGYNDETVECSSGVQHFKTRNKKWTHWAVPACIGGDVGPSGKPILRKGDKGSYVTLLQTDLLNRGYSLPKYGADGSFGAETETAVKQFQADNGLKADGVVGADTWAVLDKAPVKQKKYTVTIPHLTKSAADAIKKEYSSAVIVEE